jgi:exopolysaccharide production protein ExoQ
MPPSIALLVWFILLVVLLYFDPAKDSGVSAAVWVSAIWIFFIATKLPSQWLGNTSGTMAQNFQEGSPLDRAVDLVLILSMFGILISRSFNWAAFFARNSVLMMLLAFALVSVVWSDFPFISFKRWFRDLGNYLAILVVLSDPRPLEAVRTLLRRLCYVLISLSILLNKYFLNIGVQYEYWSGAAMFVGPTTGKNMLGVLCLISGLFFFWDTVTRWSDRKESRTRRIILVNVAYFAMTVWQLVLANSATSRVCLVIGCLVILAAHSRYFKRHPNFLKVLIPASFCLYLILAYGFDINGAMAGAVGRDSTFTGRTNIWDAVLKTHTNPLIGCGYESFWLGPRLFEVWRQTGAGIQEAHNGYLEVYLNLGLIGVFLLFLFLIASYWAICRRLKPFSDLASLSLALWTIVLFYNMTEAAAFKGQLSWVIFMIGGFVIPGPRSVRGVSVSPIRRSSAEQSPSKLREAVTI